MELMTSWEQKGRTEGIAQGRAEGKAEGRAEGKEQLLVRMINKHFGVIPANVRARFHQLSADQLDDLGEALFDFETTADLDQWLTNHSA